MDLMPVYDRLLPLAADDAQFERERRKVLDEALAAVPGDKRSLWLEVQNELDAMRLRLAPETFRTELFRRIGENVENIGDLFDAIRVKLDAFHPDRPRLAQVRALGAR